ncbi:MAG: hypothetical protein JXA03_07820 [Bacteroidales bacterium]|nr:hypothetical protein [Bacteroidales bacterium]
MQSGIKRRIVLHFCLILLFSVGVYAQEPERLSLLEDSLVNQYNAIFSENPFLRQAKADSFYAAFCKGLQAGDAFSHPFLKLDKIGKITSADERLRIITWNIPVGYGENLYYGIAQYFARDAKDYQIIRLNEPVSLGKEGRTKDWNGALYYAIVETRHAGQRYYTLLGFDLYNPLSNIKCIEIVTIDDFDDFYFTERLIRNEDEKLDTLVFEYNEKASMSLNYHEEAKMIVFDHLSPSKPSQEGQYEFYGPDFTYDGLKWEKGVWVFYSNIDVTN